MAIFLEHILVKLPLCHISITQIRICCMFQLIQTVIAALDFWCLHSSRKQKRKKQNSQSNSNTMFPYHSQFLSLVYHHHIFHCLQSLIFLVYTTYLYTPNHRSQQSLLFIKCAQLKMLNLKLYIRMHRSNKLQQNLCLRAWRSASM